jgi:pilus assembly protein CpaF
VSSERFSGLPFSSSILAERQKQVVEDFKGRAIEDIMEKARMKLLKSVKDSSDMGQLEEEIRHIVDQEGPSMNYDQKRTLIQEIMDELKGFGPLADLLDEKTDVSDVVVISDKRIRYCRQGNWYDYKKDGRPVTFRTPNHLRLLIERLCMLGNGRIDESEPEAVLNVGGFRITMAIPPKSPNGPTIAIRKFAWVPTLDDLIRTESITPQASEFLKALSIGKRNLAMVGGMGTGKTTMIATLGKYWPEDEMPILIEETRECPLEHQNLRILVSRRPNIEGKGRITIGDNIRTALTMMGSRILISEIKGGEAFYVLQAMNIGHDGCMVTFHASNTQDAVEKRLPSMISMSSEISEFFNPNLLIANALHFIVFLERTEEGKRQVREITEICYEGTEATAKPVFARRDNKLLPTGHIPKAHIEQMQSYGVKIPPEIFRNPSAVIHF